MDTATFSKKYYIKTFGCQANIADSNTMGGILEALGFEKVAEPQNPENDHQALLEIISSTDLLIINTCSVRQKSEDKVYGMGKAIRILQDELGKPKPFIVLSGCMVGSVTGERQRYQFQELERKTPWADLYVNPSQIFNLPNLLATKGILPEWALQKYNPDEVQQVSDGTKKAFVNISYGCDNFCTFCVVPYARGREISRTEKEILGEIQHLVRRGIEEIVLCGQNVNSWGLSMSEKFSIRTRGETSLPFANLLRKVHDLEGIQRVEFVSSNPFDFTRDLIEAVQLPKVSNYLHIAVQSGNDEVLKRMNRRHSVNDFVALVDDLRSVKPELEIGTDIIVGFPGETREQFMDTVELFKRIRFKNAYISMYSPRKGTPSEKFFDDDVPVEEKKWRHAELTRVWKTHR